MKVDKPDTKQPIKGWTSKQQNLENLDATVVGEGMSGNPEEYKDDAALRTTDAPGNSQADGDNRAEVDSVVKQFFAKGKDGRNRG
jgi:hypothetical protein